MRIWGSFTSRRRADSESLRLILDLERTRGIAARRRERLDALRAAQSRAVEHKHRKTGLDKAARLLRARLEAAAVPA